MPEMKTPDRITPQSPGDYLEVMSKVVFQSGMSYKIVKSKWPGTRKAFHEFDAAKVAGMTPTEVDWLTEDTRVIRNRRKLEAVSSNAQKILELDAEYTGFQKYLRSHADFPVWLKTFGINLNSSGDGLLLLPLRGRRRSTRPRRVDGQHQEMTQPNGGT